jgi:hypothetical protein
VSPRPTLSTPQAMPSPPPRPQSAPRSPAQAMTSPVAPARRPVTYVSPPYATDDARPNMAPLGRTAAHDRPSSPAPAHHRSPASDAFVPGDFSYENLLRLDAQRESRGLSPAQYERVRRMAAPSACVNADCSVCLETLTAERAVVRLGCGHGFHEPCIVQWLRVEKRCPNCRFQLVPD